MNVRHPVPDEILLDSASGSASPGKELLVQTHLAMCDDSRARFGVLEQVGGALLEALEDASLERVNAESVLARAADLPDPHARGSDPLAMSPASEASPVQLCGTVLPPPLTADGRQALDRSAWRTLGRGVQAALLGCSTPRGRTQFLYAKPGVRIMPHTHEGEELVLVLRGAFWDGDAYFGPGDVAVNDDSRVHAPVIDSAEPCLCLAVTEGPIRFVGPAGWILNRMNRF